MKHIKRLFIGLGVLAVSSLFAVLVFEITMAWADYIAATWVGLDPTAFIFVLCSPILVPFLLVVAYVIGSSIK